MQSVKMIENKTKPTKADIQKFLASIEHKTRQKDANTMLDLMDRIIDLEPRMWGDSIIGYGQYHYKYDSGHSGNSFITGFSPRKTSLTIYIMPGFKQYEKQLEKLGKHKHSVSCLYITKLENIDQKILEDIITDSVERMKKIYPDWSKKAKIEN